MGGPRGRVPNRYKSDDDLAAEIEAEEAWQRHIDGKSLTSSRRRVTFMRNEIQRRNRIDKEGGK